MWFARPAALFALILLTSGTASLASARALPGTGAAPSMREMARVTGDRFDLGRSRGGSTVRATRLRSSGGRSRSRADRDSVFRAISRRFAAQVSGPGECRDNPRPFSA